MLPAVGLRGRRFLWKGQWGQMTMSANVCLLTPLGQVLHDRVDLSDRRFQVLGLRHARTLARLEAVVAVGQPMNSDGARQLICCHLLAAAKGIAFALQDQRRRLEVLEMLDAELCRPPDRMKRIAQTNQPRDRGFIGDKARDASAHRLAADDQVLASEYLDNLEPRFPQHRLTVGCPPSSTRATGSHVGEL